LKILKIPLFKNSLKITNLLNYKKIKNIYSPSQTLLPYEIFKTENEIDIYKNEQKDEEEEKKKTILMEITTTI